MSPAESKLGVAPEAEKPLIVSLPNPALKMNCSPPLVVASTVSTGWAKRIATSPHLQRFAAAPPRNRQARVVKDEIVCRRTEVQIIRCKVA